jgi:hypothetical protein
MRNAAYFMNAIGFMLGFAVLTYAFYNKPSSSTSDESGVVIGMLVCFPVLFILFNIVIRIESLFIDKDEL